MKRKDVYICDYCGSRFDSAVDCLSHENICEKRTEEQIKRQSRYEKVKCCPNCAHCVSNFDNTLFTCKYNNNNFTVEADCYCLNFEYDCYCCGQIKE